MNTYFSFDSKDLANPACGEALAETNMFGKRSATAREEEQPPAKKPREPEPLEPEPVLREKFDKDVEERVKAQFQLMKVIAEFFTIAEGRKRLEKLPEKEQNCGMVMCTYGVGPRKLSKILRSKEHKHHEHAADVLEMLRASKKQRGMVTFDNKNNDFASNTCEPCGVTYQNYLKSPKHRNSSCARRCSRTSRNCGVCSRKTVD